MECLGIEWDPALTSPAFTPASGDTCDGSRQRPNLLWDFFLGGQIGCSRTTYIL